MFPPDNKMTDVQNLKYVIGSYPEIASSELDEFNEAIWERKEFHTKPKKADGLKTHQRLVQRYASPVTPYDEILLFHSMGTGKTRSALAIAENALRNTDVPAPIRRVFVIAKTPRFAREIFSRELEKMEETRLKRSLTEEEKREIASHIAQKYIFASYSTVGGSQSRQPWAIIGKSNAQLKKMWNNSVIILDEAHNLTAADSRSSRSRPTQDIQLQYKRFRKIFSDTTIVPNRKIVLLSGTPMINGARDIVGMLNLILPKNLELKWQDLETLKAELPERVKGRVSYIKEAIETGTPKAIMEGRLAKPLSRFKLLYIAMSQYQSEYYNEVRKKTDKKAFDLDAQRAALWAWSKKDQVSDFPSVKDWVNRQGRLVPEFWKTIDTPDKLCKFSCKFHRIVELAKTGPWPIYVYCNIVGDLPGGGKRSISAAGLKLLSLILDKMGFSRFTEQSTSNGQRYMYFTSQDRPTKKTLELFNRPEKNKDGRLCKLVLGSAASSEGYTFRNIKREIVLTPHHHYAQIAQALARGVRVGAHDSGGVGSGTVKIERLVAVPGQGNQACGNIITDVAEFSENEVIDIKLYLRSEKKDIEIKQVENIIKKNAWDCAFNFQQNKRPDAEDGSRDCDYGECEYQCVGVRNPEQIPQMDTSTWNKWYSPKVETRIKNAFRRKNSVEIMSLVQGSDMYTVLHTLNEMIVNRIPITQRDNMPVYLCTYEDAVYLTWEVILPVGLAALTAWNRVHTPTILCGENKNDILSRMSIQRMNDQLSEYLTQNPDRLLKNKPNTKCETCPAISTFPIQVQEMLIENAWRYVESGADADPQKMELAKQIAQYYKPALWKIQNNTVSALLSTFANGALRVWNPDKKKWKNASQDIIGMYQELYGGTSTQQALKKRELIQKKEAFGLYNYDTCSFCVVFNDEEITDPRKYKTGRNSITMKHEDLAQIFIQEKIFPWETSPKPSYFPWLGGTKATKREPGKFTSAAKNRMEKIKTGDAMRSKAKILAQLNKNQLASWLFLAWSSKNKIFLDKNCGTAAKERIGQAQKK